MKPLRFWEHTAKFLSKKVPSFNLVKFKPIMNLEGTVHITILTSDSNFRVQRTLKLQCSLRTLLRFDNSLERLRTHWLLLHSWLWFIYRVRIQIKIS